MEPSSSYEPLPTRAPRTTLDALRGNPMRPLKTSGGMAELTLDPNPGAICGDVGGFVDLDLPYSTGLRIDVALHVVYTNPPNSDLGNTVPWSESGRGAIVPGPRGICVKFRFHVPGDLLPSGQNKGPKPMIGTVPESSLWMLSLHQQGGGGSWEFCIPVHGDGGAPFSTAVCDVPETGKTAAPAMPASVLTRRINAGSLLLLQHRSRPSAGQMFVLLLGGAILYAGLRDHDWASRLLGVIGAFMFFGELYALGLRTRLNIRQGVIALERTCYGAITARHTTMTRDFWRLELRIDGGLPLLRSVHAVGHDGKSIRLLSHLEDSRQAHVLRRWIALVLERGVAGVELPGEMPLSRFIRHGGD